MSEKIIDFVRIALYASLVAIILMMFQLWDKDHAKVMRSTPTQTESTINNDIPMLAQTQADHATTLAQETTGAPPIATHPIIHVMTDTLNVAIDTKGGNIIQVELIKYPEHLHSTTPFLLLNNNPETRYVAQSGLLSTAGPDKSTGQAIFSTEKTDYRLADNEKILRVTLHWQNAEGVKIEKIFTFTRNDYEINLAYQIDNQSKKPWEGSLYLQLMRKNTPPKSAQGIMSLATYFGAAISSPDKPFEKISFKKMDEEKLDRTISGGWAAMIQHYFVSAWVPEKNSTSRYFSHVTQNGLYTIGMIGQPITVHSGEKTVENARFYAGPSIADRLEKVAPGLQLTIDYGWLWMISVAIFWLMQKIYNVVGNWGWSIVLVTVIIKLLFYHLSAKSYRSMSILKKLQPRITALKERFGDDKQKFTQATLELYKKEKANPMSGCLPVLVQIPVFIGLYWVLIESVQLRQAPFIFWIHDLSVKDPFYILPVLMGISMFLSQRLNPPMADPTQAKLMMFMPVIFTAMFLNFPAGLMLYWFVNNTLSFLQQWFIMRSINKS